jgi:UDP-2,4-diacetamido-2,4,6-trideoxy-beta-L-altropyranose hydrolase
MSHIRTILIRTDASTTIGSGHLMRCLTLAEALKAKGFSIAFASRPFSEQMMAMITQRGFILHRLSQPEQSICSTDAEQEPYQHWLGASLDKDAEETVAIMQRRSFDALIVDHYAINAEWHRCVRPTVPVIACIDDIANRPLDCDLLLDQNLYNHAARRYQPYVPPSTRLLLGPEFALLREEFCQKRSFAEQKRAQPLTTIRRIFVFFGGSDPTNETGKALQAFGILGKRALQDCIIDVIIGIANPHQASLESDCSRLRSCGIDIRVHLQVSNIADFMLEADFALGAGGSTTWERCCLGLPTLAVIVADNQALMTQTAAEHGVQWSAGWHDALTAEALAAAILMRLQAPQETFAVAQRAMRLVDGNGTKRVVEAILDFT